MNTDPPTTPPTDVRPPADADAYEAGLRAGYAHGYEIGLEHARTRGETDLDVAADDLPAAARLDGPNRDELIARGYIPVDHTRPPALPVRLWAAEDWAKADERDLPTTEHGRAQWRAAADAGRVPDRLAPGHADALAATGRGAGLAADLARDVAASARAVADLRARLDRVEPIAAGRCRPDRAPWRGVDAVEPAAADASDRGIGR
jgi:hypothetical protein